MIRVMIKLVIIKAVTLAGHVSWKFTFKEILTQLPLIIDVLSELDTLLSPTESVRNMGM